MHLNQLGQFQRGLKYYSERPVVCHRDQKPEEDKFILINTSEKTAVFD